MKAATSGPPRRPSRRYAVLGLALGVGALTVASVSLGISPRALVGKLRGLPPGPLVFAAAGSLVLLALQALRWWIVVRPVLALRYAQAYGAMAVGFLFNTILPMRGGDLVRVQYLGTKTGVSRAKLLGTEVVDFWSDKWGWIASFPILCTLGKPPVWLYHTLAVLGAAVVAVAAILVLMASTRLRARQPVWLANLRAGFAANHWRRLLVVETLIAPLPWLWETVVIMVASRAFGLALTPKQAFAVLTAFNVAMVVPSPGNLGSFEAGGTLALVLLGIPKESALAFLFVYHLSQVIPTVLLGATIVSLEGYTLFGKRSVLRESA